MGAVIRDSIRIRRSADNKIRNMKNYEVMINALDYNTLPVFIKYNISNPFETGIPVGIVEYIADEYIDILLFENEMGTNVKALKNHIIAGLCCICESNNITRIHAVNLKCSH